MLERVALEATVRSALVRSPAVALVGPRQVGKTTLARQLPGAGAAQWFDLEEPQAVAALATPFVAVQRPRGPVVIDEVQHAPDLFKVLRVLVDRPDNPARFLLLGSASPALLRQSSESVAASTPATAARAWPMASKPYRWRRCCERAPDSDLD